MFDFTPLHIQMARVRFGFTNTRTNSYCQGKDRRRFIHSLFPDNRRLPQPCSKDLFVSNYSKCVAVERFTVKDMTKNLSAESEEAVPFENDTEYVSENDDDDDDDESSDDDDAHLKQLLPQQGSIRRNDSFDNFISRSERIRALGKDQPPPASESSKRKIQFRDENLEDIKEVELIEDKDIYWMTHHDFDRIETDIKLTHFRWENARAGKIAFDEANNSIRGLEHFDRARQNKKDIARYKHNQSVLEEINKQKYVHGKVVDWDKVRKTSERLSVVSARYAAELGKQDEAAHRRAWGDLVDKVTMLLPSAREHKKKKRFFWQKKF